MKLFGNTHGKRPVNREENMPELQDKSLKKNAKDAGREVEDEYIEETEVYEDDARYDDEYYDDEYDDEYDDDEYDDEYDDDEYDDDEYDDDEYDDDEYDVDVEKRGLSRGKKILIAVLIILLLLFVGIGLFINYLLNLINYQAANSDYFITVSTIEEMPEESPVSSYLAELEEEDTKDLLEATPEELAQWDAAIEDVTSDDSTYEVPITDDVYNILLIGTDNRASGESARSDAMILVSLNQKTKTIYLTSFLRDCYVSIPGHGNTRLNHAFAYGGPALLEETLETNFKVHVDRYVAVDFFSFMDVIDTIGGVWLYVDDDELKVTNDYIWSMNKLMGENWQEDYLWSTGWHLMNGKQALCYARNRYTGNDYARTQRQRTVINQLISGAMQSSPSTLVSVAQVVLPQVVTDMDKSEVLSYAANVMAYLDYDIQQQQIPAAGTYSGATISGMSVISLNLDSNIQYLQSTIYAGTEYGY